MCPLPGCHPRRTGCECARFSEATQVAQKHSALAPICSLGTPILPRQVGTHILILLKITGANRTNKQVNSLSAPFSF